MRWRVRRRIVVAAMAGVISTGCTEELTTPLAETDVLPDDPGVAFSHAGTQVFPVNESNLGVNWWFVAESGGSGSGSFVNGPGSPHVGTGSARISVSESGDGFALLGGIGGGTPFTQILGLEYGTYRSVSANPAWAIALHLNVNYDPIANPDHAWQGRLVFEPYYSATVQTGEWQRWDPLTQRGWWATGAPGNTVCPINAPCTWSEILAAFPDVHIRADDAPIGFKAGSGWGEFVGYVDGLTIIAPGGGFTWDFGTNETNDPSNTRDCMNGGWQDYGFRNQGQCIRFVNTGQDSR